ncbi:MAG: Hsp20/alpha crystallin family protein [bacterium]|nr:Hsp20/alpha crystallin family protein [bacterium]
MNTDTHLETHAGDSAVAETTRRARVYSPSVDIIEAEQELLLIADIPGADAEQIDINFEQGVLTVHAQVAPRHHQESTSYLVREYGVGDFSRSFRIGDGIDPSRIEAKVGDGVLTVHLPKSDAVIPRCIAVKPA